MKMKQKTIFICPICSDLMEVYTVDKKIVAMCMNKKCETVVVFGAPVQKAFEKLKKGEL
jgi:hypothetical protein